VPARSTATMPSRARAAGVPPAPGRLDGYVAADTYTTRPGDSLWAIARRALGPQAAAARVNSLVWALWEANRDAIGTGNPSVLPVAVTLTLLKETA
jgi:resuscitation-promoting factor RpfA